MRDEVDSDFSVQDAMARGYANTSALARMLVPRVAARTGGRAELEAVVTALKRLRANYPPVSREMGKVIGGSVLNLRTHVSKVSVEKTKRSLQAVSALLSSYQEEFIQVSESLSSVTLIFDRRVHREVKGALRGAEMLEQGDDYAAIIVQSPPEIISVAGCISEFYDQLARRHVNIEDTVSSYTDTIMVVKMKDVGRAFEALNSLIAEEQKRAQA